ncbi:hypothetical protein MBORA_11040 [Methanobrevibacter oralis]|uniref:Uncharacterized protein n=1 Tax=Methanobrevibacter oralis TaxID=66851 RepID=A0A162FNB8_METOA|nr:hypothetical protein MBORA_11040 [Methanobrevibacter oralis]
MLAFLAITYNTYLISFDEYAFLSCLSVIFSATLNRLYEMASISCLLKSLDADLIDSSILSSSISVHIFFI